METCPDREEEGKGPEHPGPPPAHVLLRGRGSRTEEGPRTRDEATTTLLLCFSANALFSSLVIPRVCAVPAPGATGTSPLPPQESALHPRRCRAAIRSPQSPPTLLGRLHGFLVPVSKGLREGRDPTAAGTVGSPEPPKRPPPDAGGAGAPGLPGRPSSCPPRPQQPHLGLSAGRARAHGPLCMRADDTGSFWGVIIPSSVRQRAPSPHRASGAPRLCGARDATPGWDWPPGAHTALQDTESRLSLGQSPGRGRQRCRAPDAHGRESAGPGTPRAVTAGWPRQRHSPV